jgi:UDPglucose--hexose-1-phosphate uridylyltransferase
MPELRFDPVQLRWVIISTERGRRPSQFHQKTEHTKTSFCPFCAGNEETTPPEIYAVRENGSHPNGPGWKVRVVANKFPALQIEGELDRQAEGMYDKMNGVGAHEVIIETPDHDKQLHELEFDHLVEIFKTYRLRLIDLMKDNRLRYVLIFKNHGVRAGASLAHPHTQIIATPITPKTVALEFDSARAHYNVKERCLFCDMIRAEIDDGRRVVYDNDGYVGFAPFAARFPFETWIMPKKHGHDYSLSDDESVANFAKAVKDVLARLNVSLSNPPYNFVLHTGPNVNAQPKRPNHWGTIEHDFHWHLEIIPRLTRVAGFEWGSGFYINPVQPEEAARFLREVNPDAKYEPE